MRKISTVAELLVKIGADSSDLRKEIQASQRQLKRAFGPEALTLSEGAAGVLAGLVAAMGAVGAASVKMAADFNANKTAFTQLLGSADKAETMLNDLATFAADTPFELPGLIDASKKLLAFQFAAEDIIPIMAAVGDAVSLMGGGQEAIDGIVRALGQIQAKGKLSAEEMNQLTERGINGWKYVAESMGVSVAEVMDLTQKGAIDSTTAINAVVLGMQNDFKGGMANLSKEIPGLLSTIKDNAGAVMRELGKQITDVLDIKGVLQNAANYLNTFASAVQSSGVKNAILGLVPPEATAAVFALGGVLMAIAIPALYSFAGAMWLAIAPMAPYIALGAAIGILAYEIWKNWEPLGDLFTGLWSAITAATSSAWANIQSIFYSGVQSVLQLMVPLANIIGGGLQATIGGWLDSISGKIEAASSQAAAANAELAASLYKVKQAAGGLKVGMVLKDISNLMPSGGSKPNTVFTGLHGNGVTTGGGADGGKAASEAAKEWEKLEQKANQVSEQIKQEWVNTTQDQVAQTDYWYEKQLEKLNESAVANENYKRDLLMLNETYARKLVQAEANKQKEINDIWDKAYDTAADLQDRIHRLQLPTVVNSSGGIEVSAVAEKLLSIQKDYNDALEETKRKYRDLALEYAKASPEMQKEYLDSYASNGILADVNNGQIDFSRQIAKETIIIEKEKDAKIRAINVNYAKWKEQLDSAYNSGSIADYMATLSNQEGLLQRSLEARQALIDVQADLWRKANHTVYDDMATLMDDTYNGLESILDGFMHGTKTAGDVFKEFAQTVIDSIIKIQAQAMAASITQNLGGLFSFGASNIGTPARTGAYKPVINTDWRGTAKNFFAGGGSVSGPGTGTSDSIMALLSNGEYVVNAAAVRALGVNTLDIINTGKLPRYATGGLVTGPSLSSIGKNHSGVVSALQSKQSNNGGVQIIINNNAGVNIEKTETTDTNGLQKIVLDLTLDGAVRNVGGFGRNLKAALGVE